MTRSPRIALAALVVAIVVLAPAPAGAHAERVGSTPKEGAKVGAPPGELTISFSEPPTADARLTVTDGCNRDLVSDLEISNLEMTAALDKGQPGKWKVESRVISGIDSHATQDNWTFSVKGKADCSRGNAAPKRRDDDGEESSLPWGLIIGITGALVGVAVAVRLITGRNDSEQGA